MKRWIAAAVVLVASALLVVIRSRDPERDGGALSETTADGAATARTPARLAEGLEEPGATQRESLEDVSPSTAVAARDAGPFRGRVLDARTGEPVGRLVIDAGERKVAVDASGSFASELPLGDDVRELHVRDPLHDVVIETLDRARIERPDAEWLLRVHIGPTYFLRLAGTPPLTQESLLARLVAHRADGREEAAPWLRIHGPPAPMLRLDRPWPADRSDGTYAIEVFGEDGALRGTSAPLDRAFGVYPGIVEIALERCFGLLHGRVVDTHGRPQPGVSVLALPLSASMPSTSPASWPDATCGAEGVFRFLALPPGTYEVIAGPPGCGAAARRRVELEPGGHDVGDLVVELKFSAGSIRGRLQIKGRDRFSSTDRVRLRAADGRAYERFVRPEIPNLPRRQVTAATTATAPFSFGPVPAGEYEVTVVSPYGTRWTPERALVSPPATDLVFERVDDAYQSLCVDVEDATTATPIAPFSYSMVVDGSPLPIAEESVDGTYCLALPARTEIEWRVWAEGYRSVRLARSDFTASPEGLGARVRLASGFDARIRVLDFGDGVDPDDRIGRFAAASHPGIAGAEIRADGVVAARTGPDGVAELDADREPARIEVGAPGWRTAASWSLAGGRILASRHDVVVWMVRE